MHELGLRISDVDRDRAAAALNSAVSQGRLTWPEHEERISRVYAARTRAELAPLFADRPHGTQPVLPTLAPASPTRPGLTG